MLTGKQVGLPSKLLDELAEIERQMQLWDMEAVQLARSMEAINGLLKRL